MEKKIVESIISDTILQESKIIEVGGKTYEVAPPCIATLIKVSELVAQMPEMDLKTEDIVGESIRVARECWVISEILATIILGAKRIRDGKGGFLGGKKVELRELSTALMYEKTPKELNEMLIDFFVNRMDVGFFFGIGTSLSGINMIKPTKSQTTASGQQ